MLANIIDPNFASSSVSVSDSERAFIMQYMKQAGNQVRTETYQKLLKRFDPTQYAPTTQLIDLNISSDNGKDSLHRYGNAFGEIINRYTVRAHRTEDEILQGIVVSNAVVADL